MDMSLEVGWELPMLGKNYSLALELVNMIGFSMEEATARSSEIFRRGKELVYLDSDHSAPFDFSDRTPEVERWKQSALPFRVFRQGQDSLERIAVMYWRCQGLPESEAVSVEYINPQGKRSNYTLEWGRGFTFPGRFQYRALKLL